MPNNASLIALLLQHPDVVKRVAGTGEATAWCPWHPDKQGRTPNLGINEKKGIVKCFVCGQGGLRALAKAWEIEAPREDRRRQRAPNAPFLSAPAAMQALSEAYGLRPETIAHFKIEASPNSPSPKRLTRGAWRYPSPAGQRFKAFDRECKDKYWWGRGSDAAARRSSLYGLAEIAPGTETVYLVNGEPAVWVCWQAGVPAVCAFGEANLEAGGIKRLAEIGVKAVRIVPDLDAAGDEGLARSAKVVGEAGLKASGAKLPDELGPKGDVCNLYAWHHRDDAAFRDALGALPDRMIPDRNPLQGTRFFERDGRLWLTQQTRDGQIEKPLTNFVAWATGEQIRDDGWDQTFHTEIAGRLDSGRALPAVQVPNSKVHNLDWIAERWGYGPMINSGSGNKDMVREIMQRLTFAKGLERSTVYTHTGWREIDARWRYLMPGGAAQGVDVELASAYSRYEMPSPPESPKEAIEASLRFLEVADDLISIPLLAAAYLAPLQSIVMPAFTVWIRATSGSFKSTLAALLMCHYGRYEFNTPPATWEATARGVERYLFDLKDALAWIDDFNPRQSDRDQASQYNKADQVLRSMGNAQGRIRMRADLSMQRTYVPRAMLISTGEIYPQGESVVARTVAVEYTRGDVDRAKLTAAQGEAGLYRQAMAAYVDWLAGRYQELAVTLPARHLELRALATENAETGHARTPGAIASMFLAFELLAEFCVHHQVLTQDGAADLRNRAWAALLEVGRSQQSRLVEETSVDLYLNAIDTLLSQRKVEFFRKGSHETPGPAIDLLGWYDDKILYLDPSAAFNRVTRWFRDEGRTLGTSERALRQALLERGFLLRPDGDEKHLLKRIQVNGRGHRVLQLDIDKIPFGEHFEKRLN